MLNILSDRAIAQIRQLYREEQSKFRNPAPLRRRWFRSNGPCHYFHEFEISGGLPTEGSQIWSYTIDVTTADVTVDYDMTAAALKTHLLAQ